MHRLQLLGSPATHASHPPPRLLRTAQVAARLDELEAAAVQYPEVVVVGGGYAGVELAAVVAERLQGRGRIKLVTSTPDILPGSPEVGGMRDWGLGGGGSSSRVERR